MMQLLIRGATVAQCNPPPPSQAPLTIVNVCTASTSENNANPHKSDTYIFENESLKGAPIAVWAKLVKARDLCYILHIVYIYNIWLLVRLVTRCMVSNKVRKGPGVSRPMG